MKAIKIKTATNHNGKYSSGTFFELRIANKKYQVGQKVEILIKNSGGSYSRPPGKSVATIVNVKYMNLYHLSDVESYAISGISKDRFIAFMENTLSKQKHTISDIEGMKFCLITCNFDKVNKPYNNDSLRKKRKRIEPNNSIRIGR